MIGLVNQLLSVLGKLGIPFFLTVVDPAVSMAVNRLWTYLAVLLRLTAYLAREIDP